MVSWKKQLVMGPRWDWATMKESVVSRRMGAWRAHFFHDFLLLQFSRLLKGWFLKWIWKKGAAEIPVGEMSTKQWSCLDRNWIRSLNPRWRLCNSLSIWWVSVIFLACYLFSLQKLHVLHHTHLHILEGPIVASTIVRSFTNLKVLSVMEVLLVSTANAVNLMPT